MIMDKADQGWLVQFMEHVTKLLFVATGPRKVLAICFSKRADQRVAALAADLAALVAVAGINSHSELQACNLCVWPRPSSGAGGLGTDGPGPGGRNRRA